MIQPASTIRVVETGIVLRPDPGRVIVRFFVPGNEDVRPGDSRAAPVIERILRLTEDQCTATMTDVYNRFDDRHPFLDETFDRHAALVGQRLDLSKVMSRQRRRLLGAAFSHEYAIEAAALCNPSIVRHPEQPRNGDTAIILSVRGIGEGHRSSIGFRTGLVHPDNTISIDAPGTLLQTAVTTPGEQHRQVLHRKLAERQDDHENAAYVLDPLPERFEAASLQARLDALLADRATRRHTAATITNIEWLAACSYRARFPSSGGISERILWPQSPMERHGMEDARFVEITDGSAARYCATYTAFDGANVNQSLLTTDDFVTFSVTPMAGAAARGKGLALFPRRINGRFAALSRADRETNSVAYSDDLHYWDTAQTIQTPRHPWEVLQLGNCGSPIETPQGWLVLTHGVGPMRTYSIGAILLALHEPHRTIAKTDVPLIAPGPSKQNGYVPNVVYSCGALAIGDRLVLPYGVGDQTISIATISIGDLLAAMVPYEP